MAGGDAVGPSRQARAAAQALAVLLVALAASGCVSGVKPYYEFDADAQYKNPGVFAGNYTFGSGSTVLVAGELKPNPPEVVRLQSTMPAYPDPAGSATGDGIVQIPMAIWRPANLTDRVPVIVDAGPYYEVDQHGAGGRMVDDTIDYPGQTTPFLLRNFLPRGYAVVQLAVRGTGTAGGCMDLMGPAEVHDLDQAITYLGTQPWSNGNVAMIGASYDGSTPWEVASTGNPHLRTIVPVSGLPDIYDLMFHNGTPETRGDRIYGLNYWMYGFDDQFPQQVPDIPGQPVPLPVPLPVPWPSKPMVGQANGREPYQDLQNLACPEAYKGIATAEVSQTTGDRGAAASDFWTQRDHRQAVLDKYRGSVFLIHGLQDWNVDPHAAVPFNTQLVAAGIETKQWYGQWDHAFPDSWCDRRTMRAPEWASEPCRLDFAEVLGRWLDHYLKNDTTQPLGPAIQVEDDLGQWRNADSFPAADAAWQSWQMGADAKVVRDGAASGTVRLNPATPNAAGTILELRTEPFASDVHLSGMPTLALPFVPQGDGGELGVWMFDENDEGNVRAPYADLVDGKFVPEGTPIVGHAQLNLRYYPGGETMQTLTPGQPYVARIQFEPLEVHIPAGHRLTFWLFQGTDHDHQSTVTPAPVDVNLGPEAVLRLPVLDLDATTVFPVPGVHFPQRDLLDHMHIPKADLPSTDSVPAAGALPQAGADAGADADAGAAADADAGERAGSGEAMASAAAAQVPSAASAEGTA